VCHLSSILLMSVNGVGLKQIRGGALIAPSFAMEANMKSAILPIAALTFAVGCGATVHSSLSPTANVSQYKTFSFYNSPYKQGKPETIADQTIRSAISQDLAAKGLTEATNGPGDFQVAYHVVEQQKLAVDDFGYGFWGFAGPADITTYTQGTLVVDFIDPKTNKAFWRGTASQIVNDPNNVNPAKLDAAIAKLINRYPYGVAGTARTAM
jgi:hypothetical protein